MTETEAQALLQVEAACAAYGGEVWAECVQDHGALRGKSLSGAISALARKGLIRCSGTGREQTISLVTSAIADMRAANKAQMATFAAALGQIKAEDWQPA